MNGSSADTSSGQRPNIQCLSTVVEMFSAGRVCTTNLRTGHNSKLIPICFSISTGSAFVFCPANLNSWLFCLYCPAGKKSIRIMSQSYLCDLHLRLQKTRAWTPTLFSSSLDRKKKLLIEGLTVACAPQHWSSSDTLTSVVAMSLFSVYSRSELAPKQRNDRR